MPGPFARSTLRVYDHPESPDKPHMGPPRRSPTVRVDRGVCAREPRVRSPEWRSGSSELSKTLDILRDLFPPDAAEPDWPSCATAVSRALDGAHCSVWLESEFSSPLAATTPRIGQCFANYDADPKAAELEYLAAELSPLGRPRDLDVGELRELPALRRHVLDPLDVLEGSVVVVPLMHEGPHVTGGFCVLPNGDARPGPEGIALLAELGPWLVHAANVTRERRVQSATSFALTGSLDRLRIGVILLDEQSRVVFANRSAAQRLEGDGAASYLADTAMPVRRHHVEKETRKLLTANPEPHRPAKPHVSISRLAAPNDESTFGGATTVVFIPDPLSVETEMVEPLRKRFGLTPAEARLAALLASDFTLDEAAEHLDLTVGTVRTRLKRLFEKTGTNRQASLVRLIVTGPGLLVDD